MILLRSGDRRRRFYRRSMIVHFGGVCVLFCWVLLIIWRDLLILKLGKGLINV